MFSGAVSRGEIKCWSSNYKNPTATSLIPQGETSSRNPYQKAPTESHKSYALLHTFKSHTRAVTSIRLHPAVSGLAITTSLDGTIKILNLENLNEIYSIHVNCGISDCKIIRLSAMHASVDEKTEFGILFSCEDSSVRCWKITSCCDFYAIASVDIVHLYAYDNIQAEVVLQSQSRHLLGRENVDVLSSFGLGSDSAHHFDPRTGARLSDVEILLLEESQALGLQLLHLREVLAHDAWGFA